MEVIINILNKGELLGRKNVTIIYKKLDDNLNMFWAYEYCKDYNITLKRVKK